MTSSSSAYDAIITLGGGSQRGPKCTDLPLWVVRRLELAAHLFKRQNKDEQTDPSLSSAPSTAKIICLSAGTPHRPNYIDEASGFPILESVSAAEYLRTIHNISPSRMWMEKTSLDTIGNAYYLRTSYLDPAPVGRFKRLAIITSEFHMPRTREIFDWILMCDPIVASSESNKGDSHEQQAEFEVDGSSELKPFTAKLFGRSTGAHFKACEGGNMYVLTCGHIINNPHRHNTKHLYDVVDYYSVSDENTMDDETVLRERIQKEQASLEGFRNGVVAKFKRLRDDVTKHDEFLGEVMDFVLGDHKAYCVHENMVNYPKKEVWMKNATY